ncbi:proline/glycine betaine ABC transporter substrate-binding protein ProX [Arsenicitalea aurantiaca]|uniref:Proline/glycine betaine ABC transporter substrate-binding protein ProX n=1 Tax=Arsenicitalea aurantiaca TaxID=1783274 RepID=A0A433XEC5_9HYPH|nr:glycine betaine/L-proline ABC transporter substrate-binding protein ProX [Arsenicitalea aurantiaca]RUT32453.1 proline/glycine betaine ABC transporter substrate-binding protein ProX [Arsenicitalea aurantiaca]
MTRSILATTTFLTAALAGGLAHAAEVTPARGTWDSGWFNTEIYIAAIEALGHTVNEPVTLDDAVRYQALSQRDADFSVMEWFPLFNERFSAFDELEQVGYVIRGGAREGYLIDKATADAHGIDNIADLADPEISALFDRSGNGIADMVACPPGWDCGVVIDHHMSEFGLEGSIDLISAAYDAAMADVIAAKQAGESVLFYTWTPNWVLGELVPGEDVVWLEVPHSTLPEAQSALIGQTAISGVVGCASDPCELGFPANDIRPVAHSDFLDENPDIRRLFEVMELSLDPVAEQNVRMRAGEDTPADITRHAREWIEANQAQFDAWIAEARAAVD